MVIDEKKRAVEDRLGTLRCSNCRKAQWVTPKRNFDLFLDAPPEGSAGAYGIAKDVDLDYPRRDGIQRAAWTREERLQQLLTQGWYVYYDLDGTYLRNPGRDANPDPDH
jgi:hypothetical protein